MPERIAAALAVSLAMVAAPAVAADWQLAGLSIGDGNRSVTYVDRDSVRTVGGKLRFRSDRYYERAQKGLSRVLAVSEVDCATLSATLLRARYYDGSALIAMTNAPHEDNLYSSRSGAHWIVRRICDGAYLGTTVDNRAEDSERMFTMDWTPFPGQLALYVPTVRTEAPVTQMAAAVSVSAIPK